MKQVDTEFLLERLRQFSAEREWDQFHNPKNLVMALSGECGELNEIFQWLSPEQSARLSENYEAYQHAQEEVADIFLYLLRICDKLNIDLNQAAKDKLLKNEQKYPVERAKGSAKKYTEF